MSHTYALLEVSPATYVEIRRKLEEAGYQHALHEDGVVDLHGIALEEPPKHNGGCSNQNVLHPLGAYDDVETCGCTAPYHDELGRAYHAPGTDECQAIPVHPVKP